MSPLRVQKYGGTSVASPSQLLSVASRVARCRRAGDELVVVVSAMGETTDHLIDLARQVHPEPPQRELDMLLTTGERISMALLAMALRGEGIEAISFTGSQCGIITDSAHGQASILEVRADRIREELGRGRVVIVAGFQGVSRDREITTLGRGGSDTTAVALAGALGATSCEIYTDVPGVLSADPRCVPRARVLPLLEPPTALTLTALGAGVLMFRAASLGYSRGIPIVVRSAFDEGPGTRIDSEVRVETKGPAAVTRSAPVTLVRLTWEQARSLAGGTDILALSEEVDSGVLRAVLPAEAASRIRGGAPGVTRLSEGELVSLVSHGAMTLPLGALARTLAENSGARILASFAGPNYFSLLVAPGEGDALCAAWHAEFLDPR